MVSARTLAVSPAPACIDTLSPCSERSAPAAIGEATDEGCNDSIGRVSPLVFVQEMNNHGVQLMQEQRFEDAIDILSEGLRYTKRLLHDAQPSSDNAGRAVPSLCSYQQDTDGSDSVNENHVDENGHAREDAQAPSLPQRIRYDIVRSDDVGCVSDTPQLGYVIETPITCHPQPHQVHADGTPQCFAKLSFVIIANLALAHHMHANRMYIFEALVQQQQQQAKTNGKGQGRCTMEEQGTAATVIGNNEDKDEDESTDLWKEPLNKALRLYEVAHAIQVKESQTETDESASVVSSSPVAELMFIVNNIAQIHWLLGRTQKVETYHQQLLRIVMYTSDSLATSNSDFGIPRSQLEGVIGNIQRGYLLEQLAAAAAA